MRPQRRQPTRLPRPWDSPGKNIRVGCHFLLQCMKVKSESEIVQSCPPLSDPMDCNPLGSSIHGIFQARVLEWVAISFSRGSSQPRDGTQVSCIAGRFFTSVTREAQCLNRALKKIHLPCQLPALTPSPPRCSPSPHSSPVLIAVHSLAAAVCACTRVPLHTCGTLLQLRWHSFS